MLQTRANLARWTGECRDPRAGRDLFSKLLPDRERVRGADSVDALGTRDCIAYWRGTAVMPVLRATCRPGCCPIWNEYSAPTIRTRSSHEKTSRTGRGVVALPGPRVICSLPFC